MERKFKDMSDSSIKEMIEEINKKNKAGKGDMRDAGILLALEFELDIRKNEGKFVNLEQLEKIQTAVKRACQELKEVNNIKIYGMNDVDFEDLFGFTPDEVDSILTTFNLRHLALKFKICKKNKKL